MPACQNLSLTLEAVHNYFAQINPIASKISQDIHETKLAYGSLWHRLTPHEHADIINETIIKPEISLRYFDKFNSSSSILITSSASSRDESAKSSIAAETTKNVLVQNKSNTIKTSSIKAKESEPMLKNYYGFDRNRLRTYASQKVALKIMRDEILGTYRDEHSKPFSYKTKSQINLHIFTENPHPIDDYDDRVCLLSSTNALTDDRLLMSKELEKNDLRPFIVNHKKLQTELNSHINKTKEKETTAMSFCLSPYEKVNNLSWSAAKNKNSADNNSNMLQNSLSNSSNAGTKEQRLISYIDSAVASPSTVLSYAVYSDDYFERKESTNLMQNCYSSEGLTASSSSAGTTDDEQEDDEDEKTLCEDVKLLDNDVCLRRGFDFLNNW